ncbi:MAG: hypothetical protein R2713_15935 [Ilumatobacteraceae bacterium]
MLRSGAHPANRIPEGGGDHTRHTRSGSTPHPSPDLTRRCPIELFEFGL